MKKIVLLEMRNAGGHNAGAGGGTGFRRSTDSSGQGYWYIDGGNDTEDRIFLLSHAEADKYFKIGTKDACAAPTAYAIKQGAFTISGDETVRGKAAGSWWLRSPGTGSDSASVIFVGGSRNHSDVDSLCEIVRPAMWLDLNSVL